jgi:hypothetical protein
LGSLGASLRSLRGEARVTSPDRAVGILERCISMHGRELLIAFEIRLASPRAWAGAGRVDLRLVQPLDRLYVSAHPRGHLDELTSTLDVELQEAALARGLRVSRRERRGAETTTGDAAAAAGRHLFQRPPRSRPRDRARLCGGVRPDGDLPLSSIRRASPWPR